MSSVLDFKNKRVTVMGLGLHGGAVGTIEWLVRRGAKVTATDLKTEDELKSSLEKLGDSLGRKLSKVEFVLGAHREEDFKRAAMVVRNPAVPRASKYLAIAREAKVPIEMDSSLFFKASAKVGVRDIIGVTGSKGKTSCATFVAQILAAQEREVILTGTEGSSPLAELKHVDPETTVVFELSSWRLEALQEYGLSPPTAIVTSLYHDHLNTYENFEQYANTKKTIYRFQDVDGRVLLNADDEKLSAWAEEAPGRVWWFSRRAMPAERKGICVRDEEIVVRVDKEVKMFSMRELKLTREHEQRNALPGILLAYLDGMSIQQIKQQAGKLTGLPHRLELVRELAGVSYVNDSAATMPEATIAALSSLRGKNTVLILGGNDKNLEFAELGQAIGKGKIRALVWLPGNATDKIRQVLADMARKIDSYDAADMEAAVKQARAVARVGDTVLLSPAATSFGLFLHEFDRGEKFRAAVLALN